MAVLPPLEVFIQAHGAEVIAELVKIAQKQVSPSEPITEARNLVFKSNSDLRVTTGLAYPHNRPDVSTAADGFRDFVSKDVLREAAWSWLTKNRSVGLRHADDTEGHGTVVESYLWPGADWLVKASDGSEHVIREGDWLCSVRWDEPTWNLIKSGELNGFSPQGAAKRRTPSPETLASLRS